MAYETGTANDLEDLFSKIVEFATTNGSLVAQSQNWVAERVYRDNVESVSTDLGQQQGYNHILKTFRLDPRTLNVDSNDVHLDFRASSLYKAHYSIHITLRNASDVSDIALRAGEAASYMIKNFELFYSDDGVTWDSALQVDSDPLYAIDELKTFEVPAVGSHKHWKIVTSSSSSSYQFCIRSIVLLNGQNVVNQFGSEAILKGPGTTGTDEIYASIRSEYDALGRWYNLFFNGFSGYDESIESSHDQPGSLTLSTPMISCWNQPMPYWFSASGRSIRACVKVSTVYQGFYLGFIKPYASPSQYPYPLAIGASMVPALGSRDEAWSFANASLRHSVFVAPGTDVNYATDNVSSTLYLRGVDGAWRCFLNRSDGPESVQGVKVSNEHPYNVSGSARSVWPHCVFSNSAINSIAQCIDGSYLFKPCVLIQGKPTKAVIGEFEGIFSVSSFQNAPENTSTLGGETVVVFQNIYRNSLNEFWALSLNA